MATTEYVLSSLTDLDRHIGVMAAASGPEEVVEAVSAYLAAWSRDRIRNLQKVDGGWGPFDENQRLAPLQGIGDISRIADSMRRQCAGLRDMGIEPTPELLELDLFFFFAREVMEAHAPSGRSAPAGPRHGYVHWSDRRGTGASA